MWVVLTPAWWFWCWPGGEASSLFTWMPCGKRSMQRNIPAACLTTSTTCCAFGSTTTSTRTRTAPAWRTWARLHWPNTDILSQLWALKILTFLSLSKNRALVFPSPTGRRRSQCFWALEEAHAVLLPPTLMKPTGTWTETSWSCDYRDWEDSLYIRITSCLSL